jgi:hypothetical protein
MLIHSLRPVPAPREEAETLAVLRLRTFGATLRMHEPEINAQPDQERGISSIQSRCARTPGHSAAMML